MKNKEWEIVLEQIYQALSNDEWLRKNNFTEKFIKKHIKSKAFISNLNYIIEAKDYSCKAVLSLCLEIMKDMKIIDSIEDWLSYLYSFTLNKAFPYTITIADSQLLASFCNLYLEILGIIIHNQKLSDDDSWQRKYPIDFLTSEEERSLESSLEYKAFVRAFEKDYIYQMMLLSKEVTGHNTLDHTSGVHYLALYIARQIKDLGVSIDLGRVSGAAAGHDIGKFGCKVNELKRVPYLHYYYTDQWFKKHNITYIRNIAVNHSTWDLELENLSLESLVLIYADFRVKNYTDDNQKTSMHIYSLADSFDVILQKLDNVDDVKRRRYQRVYSKLKDFEDYLIHMGVKVDMEATKATTCLHPRQCNYPLFHGGQVVDHLKYLAIDHNISMMYQLRDEASLNSILELARSEKDFENFRDYINLLQEYSTYLTQKQKLITINFLYEQLTHPEDDIRKHCAQLIGAMIAYFDEDYRKEVPERIDLQAPDITSDQILSKYLNLFICPDHKIIPAHRAWIGYNLSNMLSLFFKHCRPQNTKQYCDILLSHYQKSSYCDRDVELYLLQSARYIPIGDDEDAFEVLYQFIKDMLTMDNRAVVIAALEVTLTLISDKSSNTSFINKFKDLFSIPWEYRLPPENFLLSKIAKALNLNSRIVDQYNEYCSRDASKLPEVFLNNLKTATSWIVKKAQVDLLLEYSLDNRQNIKLHTALHLCNLLKVSAFEGVRNKAGEAIIALMPHLTPEQKNEVAIEILRALEIEDYQFAEYMPHYLGQIILFLQPIELDELLDDLSDKIKQSNSKISSLILRTIGIAISSYHKYVDFFQEDVAQSQKRLVKMLGIILNGLVHYNTRVKKVALSVIGKEIFACGHLLLEQKYEFFQLTAKKILTLITDKMENEYILTLSMASGLNHIYRFISDYIFFYGGIELPIPDKIAFFPGTFDPFSLGHKEIAKAIRDLGFEVYLTADEFSWSKRTLPNILRRNIIGMSIADQLNIYLYPSEFPTNIANTQDIRMLKNNFSSSQVHIVVGSDVIINASAYQGDKSQDSIHSLNHIIFERKGDFDREDCQQQIDKAIQRIGGNIVRLNLPPQYEDISSTQIRNYIDENRDISKLIDPLAQKYIYQNGFYRREPQYKTLMQTMSINIELIENTNNNLIDELCQIFFNNKDRAKYQLQQFKEKPSAKILLIRDANQDNKVVAFSAHHWVRLSSLYQELKNTKVTDYIRESSVGRILLIDGIYIDKGFKFDNLEQIILTETLAYCISKDYQYGIYRDMMDDHSNSIMELLKLHGFHKLLSAKDESSIFVVNMSSPCTLSLDTETVMKEPYKSNKNIQKTIRNARKKLQRAIVELYPGNLVLSFDTAMLYQNLINKICKENDVATTPVIPRQLGPAMCVPFGNILNRYIVPNTVTKALHIEKLFQSDMKGYNMGPYPYYLSLENQVKILKSFNRPIILVDDVLNKGYRINALHPLIDQYDIKVKKIILGILSARGKEIMDMQNREVDCVYFIPKLRLWFSEHLLYPFIGGDTIWRGVFPQRNLYPSINLVLPYMAPTFIKGASSGAIYNLSEVSIQNSMDILKAIEEEYQDIHQRNLTLASLGDVFIYPRCPDHGENIHYNLNIPPSHYLQNDLQSLKRLSHIILNS